MSHSIKEYLKERLSPPLYERLREASRDFTRPLFAVDPDTGRFECAADLDEAELDETQVLDALCLACELLTEAGVAFDPSDPLLEASGPSGSIDLVFDFTVEEEDVFQRFKALLAENAPPDAGFETDFQKYPGGRRVRVRLSYSSDFDYQQKKDIVDLMLLVARRQTKNVPFFGKRL